MSLYYCSINLSKGERSEYWYTLDGRKIAWDYVERMLTAISQVGFLRCDSIKIDLWYKKGCFGTPFLLVIEPSSL